MPTLGLSGARWRKGSRGTDKANCVEVAVTTGAVAVRDSKHPTGGTLIVPPSTWTVLTTARCANKFG
jgi:Domain of unknown function (DUF397)